MTEGYAATATRHMPSGKQTVHEQIRPLDHTAATHVLVATNPWSFVGGSDGSTWESSARKGSGDSCPKEVLIGVAEARTLQDQYWHSWIVSEHAWLAGRAAVQLAQRLWSCKAQEQVDAVGA